MRFNGEGRRRRSRERTYHIKDTTPIMSGRLDLGLMLSVYADFLTTAPPPAREDVTTS